MHSRSFIRKNIRAIPAAFPQDTVPPEKVAIYGGTAILTFIYVFGFNFYPASVKNGLAAILTVAAVIVFLVGLRDGLNSAARTIMSVAALILTLIGIATLLLYRSSPDLVVFARNFTGLLILVWALSQNFYSHTLSRLLLRLSVVAGIFCVIMPVFNDPVFRGGTFRMGSITSGQESLHPSAYLCVVVSFWLASIAYYKRSLVAGGAAFFVFAMVFFYEARAAEVIGYFLLIFTLISLFVTTKVSNYISRALPIAFLIAFMGFFLILYTNSQSFDIYTGSGRIGAWLDRFQRIGNRDALQILFGTGPGSDHFFGSLTWTRKATHSHNDFLNVTIELGVVGLFAFLTIMVGLIYSAPARLRYYMIIILIAPFFSGGIVFKPTVAPIMAFAVIHMQMLHREAQARRAARPPVARPGSMRRPVLSPALR